MQPLKVQIDNKCHVKLQNKSDFFLLAITKNLSTILLQSSSKRYY